MCLSCCAHRNILTTMSCLVLSWPWRLVWGRRLLVLWPWRPFYPPAPLLLNWRRSLRDPVRAPDSWSCPEEASASELAQEGFWFLWDVLSCLSGPGGLSCRRVLSCLSGPGGLSCRVLYCPVCLAPEGS